MAEQNTQTTQTTLPIEGAQTTTTPAAPTGPDVAALQRDFAAATKMAEKATKELEALKKHMGSPEFVAEALQKALGVDKKADPVKELEAIRANVTTAQAEAQTWRGKARTMALRQAAIDALDRGEALPGYKSKALALLQDNLSALDLDEESLSVRDQDALDKLVGALKGEVPVFFKAAEQKTDAKANTTTPAPQTGTPFRVPGIPVPASNGAPDMGAGNASFMDLLGVGPTPVSINVVRSLKAS